LMRMEYWEIIHPEDREIVRERGQARMHGQEVPPEYEFRVNTKYGDVRWANATTGVIDFEGSPAIIGTLFDVTDRRRAEEEKVKLYEERIEEEKRHLLEKEKILMDLHDGIGGITTNISILAELGQKARELEQVKKTLATVSRLSKEGISEIRSFMQGLDSKELNWRNLSAELRNQGSNMLDPHGISCALETSVMDGHEQPGSLVWINIIKIYKEALTNVIKHAQAGSVVVKLDINEQRLCLDIHDDGLGCTGDQGAIHGRGLSNMRRRAADIGGTLDINAEQGTQVSFILPLPIKYPVKGIEI
jgi:two-component system sensor histidine kinase UhpB